MYGKTITTGKARLRLLDRPSVNCQGMIGAGFEEQYGKGNSGINRLRKCRSELLMVTVNNAFEAMATAAKRKGQEQFRI